VRFSRLNHFYCLRLTICLAAAVMVAGCAARKPAPPPPTFPATSEAALQELRAPPPRPYDRLLITTVAAEIGEQLASAIKSARESAAQKGANALVLLHDTEFQQKVGKRTLRVRRITYLAIHHR